MAKSNLFSDLMRRIGVALLFGLFLALLFFGIAGRLDWWEAWIFIALFTSLLIYFSVWTTLNDPEMIAERKLKAAEQGKGWDQIIVGLHGVVMFGAFILAALDAGRFQWSHVPRWLQAFALVLLALSGALVLWVMRSNTFLSRTVRVQEERGHQVITTGPYHYVRHPMYVGVIVMMTCLPIFLGSWWALIPGGIDALIFIYRTGREDQTLQAELPGYDKYAQKTRYRLLPGIW
ncbi:MAG: isoprenylcysteine carboxylmethyltransferase family protein [Anaerolineales bacterium]|nr:isoprenylcysteine carboxylmethyltransferase family protein [Anaerolineales bacterium]